MKVGILVTNDGPHPADKWAEQSAGQISDIIHVDPDSVAFNELTAQKNKFEEELKDVLTPHHQISQDHEKDQLATVGTDHLSTDIVPSLDHLDNAVKAVCDHAQTKIFGSHFKRPDVVDHVRQVIGSHMASAKHIERSWHADNNPDHPAAQAFKAKYHG